MKHKLSYVAIVLLCNIGCKKSDCIDDQVVEVSACYYEHSGETCKVLTYSGKWGYSAPLKVGDKVCANKFNGMRN